MINGDVVSKALFHPLDHLRCEPDLRHQDQSLLAFLDDLIRHLQIDLGLAAAGGPVQEDNFLFGSI